MWLGNQKEELTILIRVSNLQTVNTPYTFLTNSEIAGTNTLRWKNPNGFNASWAIQIGQTGQEQSEIVLLDTNDPASIGTTAGLTNNTLYPHPADTPVYAIKYDQLVFERSTTGTAGTAIPMTNGTVNIQSDQPFTQFDDTTGSTTYAYKTYYRNSVLNVTSTESDWITSSGFSYYSLGKMRQRVKDKLVSAQYLPDDTLINDWINEWLEIMTNAAISVNQDYNMGTANITVSGDGLGTVTQSDFKQLRRAWFIDGTGTVQMQKMEDNSFAPQSIFNSTTPFFAWRGDNVMEIRPPELNGTINMVYYKLNPVLVNDTDELPQPMKGYTNAFVNYALSQALFKDTKIDEAKQRETEAIGMLTLFKNEISPRTKTGPTYMSIVETINPTEIWW